MGGTNDDDEEEIRERRRRAREERRKMREVEDSDTHDVNNANRYMLNLLAKTTGLLFSDTLISSSRAKIRTFWSNSI